jgi:flagellar biosynthesis/type III secretory pathway protein FliH
MQELDRRNVDPEELLQFGVTRATNAHIVRNARKQMEKATQDDLAQGREQGREQGQQEATTATIKKLLKMSVLTVE